MKEKLLRGAAGGIATFLLMTNGGCDSAGATAVVDPDLSVPLKTGIATLVGNGIRSSFSATGRASKSTGNTPGASSPISESGTVTIGPASNVIFRSGPLAGTKALKSVEVLNGQATQDGQTAPISGTTTTYYSALDSTILATSDGTSFSYYSPYTYPASVKAGDAGTLGSATTGGLLPSTTTSYYRVASDTATSLLVTITNTFNNSGQVVSQTTYRVSTSGAISLVSETVTNKVLGAIDQSVAYEFK